MCFGHVGGQISTWSKNASLDKAIFWPNGFIPLFTFLHRCLQKQIFGLAKSKPNPNQTPKSSVFCLNFDQKELWHDHIDHSKQWEFIYYFGKSPGPILGISKNGVSQVGVDKWFGACRNSFFCSNFQRKQLDLTKPNIWFLGIWAKNEL